MKAQMAALARELTTDINGIFAGTRKPDGSLIDLDAHTAPMKDALDTFKAWKPAGQ